MHGSGQPCGERVTNLEKPSQPSDGPIRPRYSRFVPLHGDGDEHGRAARHRPLLDRFRTLFQPHWNSDGFGLGGVGGGGHGGDGGHGTRSTRRHGDTEGIWTTSVHLAGSHRTAHRANGFAEDPTCEYPRPRARPPPRASRDSHSETTHDKQPLISSCLSCVTSECLLPAAGRVAAGRRYRPEWVR
jgi:hypothetical protein